MPLIDAHGALSEELRNLFTEEESAASIGDPAKSIADTTREYAIANGAFIMASMCQPFQVKVKSIRFLAKYLRAQAKAMEEASDFVSS